MTQPSESSISIEERISEIGLSLKNARDAKQLTLNQVHAETRVSMSKLALIEQGDFETLGDEVFVQGYIRRFAKAVGADADLLVANYQSCFANLAAEPSVDLGEQADVRERPALSSIGSIADSKNSKWLIAVLPFIAVVLIVVVIVILAAGESSKPNDLDLSAAAELGETLEQALPDNAIVEYSVDVPEADAEVLPGSGPVEAVAASDTQLFDQQNPDLNSNSLSDQSTIQTPIEPQQERDRSTLANGSSDPAGTESLLELSFVDECWIEVRDKNNELVFADLRNSGDNLRLFGEAPLNVMLGNVHAVDQLKLDGKQIVVEPVGSRKTLRLRLDVSN